MAVKNTVAGGTDWVKEELKYPDLNDTFDNAFDRFDTSSGHSHDGTDSKALGWVIHETKKITSAVTTTTFSSMPDKKLWKLVLKLHPAGADDASAGDIIGLQINTDTGATQYQNYFIEATTPTASTTDKVILGRIDYDGASSNRRGISGEAIIQNGQGDSDIDNINIKVNAGGDTTFGCNGWWKSNATITSLTVYNDTSARTFEGELALYYNAEAE